MGISSEVLKSLYHTMLRIRKVQLRIESLYHLDEMKTPVHLYIGQEAVAAGVCANLEPTDYISSNHRGHGHYLAKGGNLNRMIAELYCRKTGCAAGRGGSMHLVDPSVGHLGSSSIVGGGIPIGTGLGFASKMQRQNRVSVIFFGDGAADEGVLYESINFAILKRLPVIFVCENNQFSVCSRVQVRWPGELIFHATPPDRMHTVKVDGNSVEEVYEAAAAAVARARTGQGPSLMECRTYRIRGHAGAGSDAGLGYRTPEEIAEWATRCPVSSLRGRLMAEGTLDQAGDTAMHAAIEAEIDEAFHFAQTSALPIGEDLLDHIFGD